MVKINYQELTLDHIVEFSADRTIFACARINGNGHLRLFLIFDAGLGRVYTRNGRIDSWEHLDEAEAEIIRQRVRLAYWNQIPVYKINGCHTE